MLWDKIIFARGFEVLGLKGLELLKAICLFILLKGKLTCVDVQWLQRTIFKWHESVAATACSCHRSSFSSDSRSCSTPKSFCLDTSFQSLLLLRRALPLTSKPMVKSWNPWTYTRSRRLYWQRPRLRDMILPPNLTSAQMTQTTKACFDPPGPSCPPISFCRFIKSIQYINYAHN